MRFAMTNNIRFALIMIAVSGCSQSIAEKFPPQDDFCEEQGRALTAQEMKSIALEQLSDNKKMRHFQNYKSMGPNKAQKERDIIAEYLSEHKDCCAILEPAYLRENWNGELVEVFYNEGEMRNWNKDFQIASDPQWFGVFGDEIVPGSGNYSSEYKISACGIIGEINRG